MQEEILMGIAALKLFCFFSLSLTAQTMRSLHGTAVSGRRLTLPDDIKGRVAVLLIGFTRNSSSPVAAWAGKFKSDFRDDGNLIVLRLAFLEEVPRMFRPLARSGVEKSAGQDRNEVVPIFESEAIFKSLVHYSAADDAYALVLDRSGKIRGVFTGDVATQYFSARERVATLISPERAK